MSKKNKNRILAIVLVLLILILLVEIMIWIQGVRKNQKEHEEPGSNEVSSTVEETSSEPGTEEESSEISTTEEVYYPAPSYSFQTEELVVEVPGILEEYTVAWVSDLHMVTDHEVSDDILAEDLDAVRARYDFFQTADGVHGEDLLSQVIDFLNYGEFDGIIFGGDMLDYCSVSNLALLEAEFARLDKNVPVLYIRADHDYGFWYGGDGFTEADAENMHRELADGDDLSGKYLDFGEFVILGVNRSTKDMFPAQYSILDEMFSRAESEGKPVIVATHVPYASKIDDSNEVTLYDRSMEIRNKIYYWGGGNYVPNDVTTNFLDKIYREDTNVVQVLAGHLHAGWDGKLTEQVRQHIFEPAYLGSIGIIRFVPKGEGD